MNDALMKLTVRKSEPIGLRKVLPINILNIFRVKSELKSSLNRINTLQYKDAYIRFDYGEEEDVILKNDLKIIFKSRYCASAKRSHARGTRC